MSEVLCRGKINLNLKVLSKRNDGYHNISSIMSELNFGDILRIKKSNCCDSFWCNIRELNRDNLVLKALSILREGYRVGLVEIELEKHLPIASGMGGGSSNAANFLLAMNEIFGLRVSRDDMFHMAGLIGMDVSFFIDGGIQVASSRGDILEPISGRVEDVLIVYEHPSFSGNIYQSMRDEDFNTGSYNDLFGPVLRNNLPLKEFYEYISKYGDFRMTGAGGAFYLLGDIDYLKSVHDRIEAKYKKIGRVLVPVGDRL